MPNEPVLLAFADLESIDLRDTHVTGAALGLLTHLPKLEEVRILGSNITAEDVKRWRAQRQAEPWEGFLSGEEYPSQPAD
jgi:hypothetical protein